MENFYSSGPRFKALDPRGMFILQGEASLHLWVGAEVPEENKQAYFAAAQQLVGLL